MKNQDKMRFAKVMAVLAEIFDQGQEPSEIKIELYFKALAEFEIGEVERAASDIIKGRVYPAFPKPAEIIQEIQGSQANRAALAWLDVLEAVKRIGPYQSVKFPDAVIHSVIEAMGGWVRLGDMLCDEEKWKQKEFERLYEIIAKSPRGKHPDYLAGATEIKNAADGYERKAVIVKIGFTESTLVRAGER